MKTVLLTDVPKNVIFYINEMRADFISYLKIGNSKSQEKEQIENIISDLDKLLNAQEWKINHFGVLVEHFYDSKIKNSKLSHPLAKQIIKECDVVLGYCQRHFEITYFPSGQFLISQKIGKVG